MILDPDRPATRQVISDITWEKLLRMIEIGVTPTKAAKACGIDISTVWRRVRKDPVFADKFKTARQLQAHSLIDEALEIADSVIGRDMAEVQAAKLKVDTKKWAASKLAPRQYGEKMMADHTHTVGVVLLPALDLAQQAVKGELKAAAAAGLKQIAETSEG